MRAQGLLCRGLVLVSVNAASDRESCPLGWRLSLAQEWDAYAERRTRAKTPDELRHREKWRLALDRLDELLEWGLAPQVVQTDGGYGDITAFRVGLEQRELEYVVQVKATTSAHRAAAVPVAPSYQGSGRQPKPRYPDRPSSLRELVLAAASSSTASAWTTTKAAATAVCATTSRARRPLGIR